MIKRILTVFAAIVAGAAGTSLASAQGYPPPPSPIYSTPPSAYPDEDDRPRGADAVPDFDAVDDDQSPQRAQFRGVDPAGTGDVAG